MSTISAFILYLILFRLSIIVAGIISIILGYRLFCRSVPAEGQSGDTTTVDATIGSSRFKLSNAAPGTCFALFGVIIISAMLLTGRPEITFDLINGASEKSGETKKMSLLMRGEDGCSLRNAMNKGRELERRGEFDKAIQVYQEGLSQMALPMNYLAWLYHKKGENRKARPLARMATWLLPDDANSLDTLAEIEFSNGAYREALVLIEKASGINPEFKEKLDRFRKAAQSRQPGLSE